MRTKYSIINILVSVGMMIPNVILTLAVRITFVHVLSLEYLGINGLFSNILNVLSVVELGVAPAMIYSLYKPIALEDHDKIGRLLNLYRRLYWMASLMVLVCGLSLVPFLDHLIKDKPDIEGLTVFYLMYLVNSVSTYLFSYKQAVITAHQKTYITVAYTQAAQIVKSVIQILILLFTHNFMLYLSIQIVCSIVPNWLLAKKADKMYPYITESKGKLPTGEVQKDIYKNVIVLCVQKLGTVLVNNTDNLVISACIGLTDVGIYSNYIMISNHVKTILGYVYGSFSAGIGNLSAVESKEVIYTTYRTLNYLMFLMFGYSAIAMFVLFNPFMRICFGSNYLFSTITVFLIIFDFYVWGMRQITLKFRDAQGLFWYDRYKPIFEVSFNLIISIFLAYRCGINGVIIGTLVSTLLTGFWVEPYVFIRYGIREHWKKRLVTHFLIYINQLFLLIVSGAAIQWCCSFIPGDSIPYFILRGIICTGLFMIIIIAATHHTKEYQNLSVRIRQLIKKQYTGGNDETKD